MLRLPMNGSIFMNLDGLYTRTAVSFPPSLPYDELVINGHGTMGKGSDHISYLLEIIRGMANINERARVISGNNCAYGAGIASSASVPRGGVSRRGNIKVRTWHSNRMGLRFHL
jgi:diphosphomevalonate decarboxylase